MSVYISLLRGINVSGKNLIKMDTLKQIYADLGCKNVLSYVQSGNVIFQKSETNVKKLGMEISEGIYSKLGMKIPLFVFSLKEWEKFIMNNPLLEKDNSFLHITLLAQQPETFDLEAIHSKKAEGEEVMYLSNCFYLFCPFGYGNSKLTNTFFESKCKVTATTRNWKSVNEIFRLAQSLEKHS